MDGQEAVRFALEIFPLDQKSQEEKLDGYYKLNVQHLQFSFWASLIALVVGLLALVSSVLLYFAGKSGLGPQLAAIGGVLTQFIGAGFFYLYSRNFRQLNVFYEKLIKHQDTMYAIVACGASPRRAPGPNFRDGYRNAAHTKRAQGTNVT